MIPLIVRLALHSDLEALYQLFDGYTDENKDKLAHFGIVLSREKARKAVEGLVGVNSAYLAEQNGRVIGGIAGIFTPCLFTNDQFYSAMLFYVVPRYRRFTRSFLDQLSVLLKEIGTTQFVISVPAFNDDKMGRFYEIMGFKLIEHHYAKAV